MNVDASNLKLDQKESYNKKLACNLQASTKFRGSPSQICTDRRNGMTDTV